MQSMSRCEKSVGSGVYRRSAWRGLVLLSTAVVLVSACGSDDKGSSSEITVAVAGAQENAVASGGVCYSWPNGTTDAQPCAVGLKGPGGGRVYFDAGVEQPWGRFLEVAPQAWGATLVDCGGLRFNCGTADPSKIPEKTSDARGKDKGYFPCQDSSSIVLLPGEAGATGWGVGDGRRNTEVLSKTAECVDGTTSSLTLATGYRGGGLSDWYLPSFGELMELCTYLGRNEIGGFVNMAYTSSTTEPYGSAQNPNTMFYGIDFGEGLCAKTEIAFGYGEQYYGQTAVRPIRAFS